VARGPEAATLLDGAETRNEIINELMEVSCHVLSCTRAVLVRQD